MRVVEIHSKHLGCRTSTDLWLTRMGQRSENDVENLKLGGPDCPYTVHL